MVSEGVLPHSTQWRYLLHHVTCVTYPRVGMLFCARSSSSLRGKLPQKFPHSRNAESRRLIAHVGILYSRLHSASDEGTVGSDAQWTQPPCGSQAQYSLVNSRFNLCTFLIYASNERYCSLRDLLHVGLPFCCLVKSLDGGKLLASSSCHFTLSDRTLGTRWIAGCVDSELRFRAEKYLRPGWESVGDSLVL